MPIIATGPTPSQSNIPTMDALVCSPVERTHVAEAIHLLSRRERLILELFYVEQLTLPEVAAVLEMEIRDVILHGASAMTMLRGALSKAWR